MSLHLRLVPVSNTAGQSRDKGIDRQASTRQHRRGHAPTQGADTLSDPTPAPGSQQGARLGLALHLLYISA